MTTFNLRPTYYFGQDALDGIEIELKKNNFSKPLLLFGKGSIRRNGIYNKVSTLLTNRFGSSWVEFEGIEPNPRESTIKRAIDLVVREKVDLIIAVGGGSVIDASKVIGVLSQNPQYDSVWDYVMDPSKIKNPSIKIMSVITLAGTASENNGGSVITNEETFEKKSVFTPSAVPFAVIQNPEFTFSVNKFQTASGIFDCFSHLTEQFLSKNSFYWTNQYIIANLKTLMHFAKCAIDNPEDYEARSNIMWTTSMALNGTTSFLNDGDWNVHTIEHAFSGLWDITHGAGLALITPYYYFIRARKEAWFADKLIELGDALFGVKTVRETLNKITGFINLIGLKTKWTDFKEIVSFESNEFNFLVNHCLKFGDKDNKQIYFDTIELIQNKAN